MIRFNNDYNHGTHPKILAALQNINENAYGGYGKDEWCLKACEAIKKYINNSDADIHFLVGGTQVNYIAIASMLKPFQGIISPESGHINVHETGAVENSGHKVLSLPATNGKITAQQIEEQAILYENSPVQEHIVQPKAVYISFPTEYGTIYSKSELENISQVCKNHGLYLFIDGARLGYGLGSEECDVSIADLANYSDMFYIGGTKCGALFGEALIITNKFLQPDFRSYIKQNGAMLAKGWLLGIQFYTLFNDGLYFEITKNASSMAKRIKNAFQKKGINSFIDSPTNQQFVVVTDEQKAKLSEKFIFEDEGKTDSGNIIRFCTSWSTKEEELSELLLEIEKL